MNGVGAGYQLVSPWQATFAEGGSGSTLDHPKP